MTEPASGGRKASKTAILVAAYRARESRAAAPICRDPWAAALAGDEGEALAARQDAIFPHLHLWTAVRTAYLDGHVTWWTDPARGARQLLQVVILGAGLDTRAARLARPGVRYFEVDQPATQAEKRRGIAAQGGYPVDAATFVACDFEHEDFLDRLVATGFATDQPALILWEGVTPYLPEAAVRATLARIATGAHPATVLLFDHLLKAHSKRPDQADTRAFVADLGEPVRFGTSDALPICYDAGFRHVRSVSFDDACLTITGSYAREREFRFQRIVLATRTPPAGLPF